MNILKTVLNTMNKMNRIALPVFAGLLIFVASNALAASNHSALNENSSFKPSAVFKDIWVDYDVSEAGQNGMRIHVKFTVNGMKNLDSYLAIYFETSDGVRLKDNNNKFNSTSDEVAVYKSMKPAYDPADYNDLSVFMPYDELDLSDGDWDLRMDVDLIYKAGGLIQHLTYKEFNYKQGDDDPVETTKTGKSNRIWVDYNVNQNGRKGMVVHFNFEVTGLKAVDSMLAVRIRNERGDYLESASAGFANDAGDLEVTYQMKPGYETTVYEDATVFIPYSEIVLRSGVWNLNLDVDLRYENGDLIQHLDFYDFEFTRP